jgi:hypothetical protein
MEDKLMPKNIGIRGRNHSDTKVRKTCRVCEKKLKKGDPARLFVSIKTGETYSRYNGTCKTCIRNYSTYYRWLHRTNEEILAQIEYYKLNIGILKDVIKIKKRRTKCGI